MNRGGIDQVQCRNAVGYWSFFFEHFELEETLLYQNTV